MGACVWIWCLASESSGYRKTNIYLHDQCLKHFEYWVLAGLGQHCSFLEGWALGSCRDGSIAPGGARQRVCGP